MAQSGTTTSTTSDEPIFTLWVPGTPVPAARAIPTGSRGRFTPERERLHKELIRDLAAEQILMMGGRQWALDERFIVGFRFQFAANHWKRAGDLDNYIKTVKDALKGIVWVDDKVRYIPRYEDPQATIGEPGTWVWVRLMESETDQTP